MTPDYPASCYETTGGIVYFSRLCSKVRLHAHGRLPDAYHGLLGSGFDGRLCRFLGVDYEDLATQVRAGLSDDEALEWCFGHGRRPDSEQVLVFNSFMTKRGWRDEQADGFMPRAIRDAGLPDDGSLLTIFDTIEAEEGRWRPDQWRDVFGGS